MVSADPTIYDSYSPQVAALGPIPSFVYKPTSFPLILINPARGNLAAAYEICPGNVPVSYPRCVRVWHLDAESLFDNKTQQKSNPPNHN